MKALIIEDKRQLADAVCEYLRRNKIIAVAKYDGQVGFEESLSDIYDAIILDLMLPSKDGFSIIRDLRKRGVDTPILVVTARASTDDKVKTLLSGADDYMTKPFVLEELLARLYALTRRKGIVTPNVITFGDISLDILNHTMNKDGKKISLSLKEYQIIEMLISSGEKIVQKSYLMDKVWGIDSVAYYNSAEVYVTFLRRKLKALASAIRIKSIRNVGYRLIQEECPLSEAV